MLYSPVGRKTKPNKLNSFKTETIPPVSIIRIAAEYLNNFIQDGDVAVDATLQNVNDTTHLVQTIGARGHLYCFNEQLKPIENLKRLLAPTGYLNRLTLFNTSYANMYAKLPLTHKNKLKLVMFNFTESACFLSSGNADTQHAAQSVIHALEISIKMLAPQGRIIAVLDQQKSGDTSLNKQVRFWLRQQANEDFEIETIKAVNNMSRKLELVVISKLNLLAEAPPQESA